MGQFDQRFAARIEWTGFINQSGQDIPPFSVIQAQSWQAPDPSGADSSLSATPPLIVGNQPGSLVSIGTVDPNSCYVTGSGMTPAGSNGVCARPTLSTPLLVSIAGAQTDANDSAYRLVGPAQGSWQVTRDYPGFVMLSQPQQGYALIAPAPPAQMQLYMTTAGPESTPYPKLSSSPTVYYAQLLQGATFPKVVGAQTLQPIANQTSASFDYVWCDQTYLFQGTIVATLNGIVIGLVTGSSFQIGMAGTLGEALAAGGSAVANVVYVDALGNTVNDILTVWENVGLPSGQTIASGTGVFIEWDNSLFNWVVVSAACGTNKGGQDTPISRQKSDTPISTGGSPGDGF
jgi:hypothetical protein